MDKIILKNLEIYARHGAAPGEKELPQKFLVSVEALSDLRRAGITDELSDTADYGRMAEKIREVFTGSSYDLIEKCAEETALELLLRFPVSEVTVTVKKPWAPMGMPLDYAAVEITRGWHRAYLGLGANLGDREENIASAMGMLEHEHTRVVRRSSLYETKPYGYPDQPDFMNCAAEISTLLSPGELMALCLDTELKLKRERKERWGPRTIDIDILLYDDLVTEDDLITIPHPDMTNRLFVLEPLSEIAPNAVHPLEKQRIAYLKNSLKAASGQKNN